MSELSSHISTSRPLPSNDGPVVLPAPQRIAIEPSPTSSASIDAQHERNICIIDTIDLDSYDEVRAQTETSIRSLCTRIKAKPVGGTLARFKHHNLLKLLEVTFFNNQIKETAMWQLILDTYSELATAYSDLSKDTHYQLRAVNLLAHYINHQCGQFRGFRRHKIKEEVYECCDEISYVMRIVLFDNAEHKAMVMLKTNMVPENAFLLIVLCKRIRKQIVDKVSVRCRDRASSVILLNASLLLLNMWYQLMETTSDRQTFTIECELVLRKLSHLREGLALNSVAHNLFYETFQRQFKTAPIQILCKQPINKKVIERFFNAFVKYWDTVNPKPTKSINSTPCKPRSTFTPDDDDDDVVLIVEPQPIQSTQTTSPTPKTVASPDATSILPIIPQHFTTSQGIIKEDLSPCVSGSFTKNTEKDLIDEHIIHNTDIILPIAEVPTNCPTNDLPSTVTIENTETIAEVKTPICVASIDTQDTIECNSPTIINIDETISVQSQITLENLSISIADVSSPNAQDVLISPEVALATPSVPLNINCNEQVPITNSLSPRLIEITKPDSSTIVPNLPNQMQVTPVDVNDLAVLNGIGISPNISLTAVDINSLLKVPLEHEAPSMHTVDSFVPDKSICHSTKLFTDNDIASNLLPLSNDAIPPPSPLKLDQLTPIDPKSQTIANVSTVSSVESNSPDLVLSVESDINRITIPKHSISNSNDSPPNLSVKPNLEVPSDPLNIKKDHVPLTNALSLNPTDVVSSPSSRALNSPEMTLTLPSAALNINCNDHVPLSNSLSPSVQVVSESNAITPCTTQVGMIVFSMQSSVTPTSSLIDVDKNTVLHAPLEPDAPFKPTVDSFVADKTICNSTKLFTNNESLFNLSTLANDESIKGTASKPNTTTSNPISPPKSHVMQTLCNVSPITPVVLNSTVPVLSVNTQIPIEKHIISNSNDSPQKARVVFHSTVPSDTLHISNEHMLLTSALSLSPIDDTKQTNNSSGSDANVCNSSIPCSNSPELVPISPTMSNDATPPPSPPKVESAITRPKSYRKLALTRHRKSVTLASKTLNTKSKIQLEQFKQHDPSVMALGGRARRANKPSTTISNPHGSISSTPPSSLSPTSNDSNTFSSLYRSITRNGPTVQNDLVTSTTTDQDLGSHTPSSQEQDASVMSPLSADGSAENLIDTQSSQKPPVPLSQPNVIEAPLSNIFSTSIATPRYHHYTDAKSINSQPPQAVDSIEVKISYSNHNHMAKRLELDISETAFGTQDKRGQSAVRIAVNSKASFCQEPVQHVMIKKDEPTLPDFESIESDEDWSGTRCGTPLVDETDCINSETDLQVPLQKLPNLSVYGKIPTDCVDSLLEATSKAIQRTPLLSNHNEIVSQKIYDRALDSSSSNDNCSRSNKWHSHRQSRDLAIEKRRSSNDFEERISSRDREERRSNRDDEFNRPIRDRDTHRSKIHKSSRDREDQQSSRDVYTDRLSPTKARKCRRKECERRRRERSAEKAADSDPQYTMSEQFWPNRGRLSIRSHRDSGSRSESCSSQSKSESNPRLVRQYEESKDTVRQEYLSSKRHEDKYELAKRTIDRSESLLTARLNDERIPAKQPTRISLMQEPLKERFTNHLDSYETLNRHDSAFDAEIGLLCPKIESTKYETSSDVIPSPRFSPVLSRMPTDLDDTFNKSSKNHGNDTKKTNNNMKFSSSNRDKPITDNHHKIPDKLKKSIKSPLLDLPIQNSNATQNSPKISPIIEKEIDISSIEDKIANEENNLVSKLSQLADQFNLSPDITTTKAIKSTEPIAITGQSILNNDIILKTVTNNIAISNPSLLESNKISDTISPIAITGQSILKNDIILKTVTNNLAISNPSLVESNQLSDTISATDNLKVANSPQDSVTSEIATLSESVHVEPSAPNNPNVIVNAIDEDILAEAFDSSVNLTVCEPPSENVLEAPAIVDESIFSHQISPFPERMVPVIDFERSVSRPPSMNDEIPYELLEPIKPANNAKITHETESYLSHHSEEIVAGNSVPFETPSEKLALNPPNESIIKTTELFVGDLHDVPLEIDQLVVDNPSRSTMDVPNQPIELITESTKLLVGNVNVDTNSESQDAQHRIADIESANLLLDFNKKILETSEHFMEISFSNAKEIFVASETVVSEEVVKEQQIKPDCSASQTPSLSVDAVNTNASLLLTESEEHKESKEIQHEPNIVSSNIQSQTLPKSHRHAQGTFSEKELLVLCKLNKRKKVNKSALRKLVIPLSIRVCRMSQKLLTKYRCKSIKQELMDPLYLPNAKDEPNEAQRFECTESIKTGSVQPSPNNDALKSQATEDFAFLETVKVYLTDLEVENQRRALNPPEHDRLKPYSPVGSPIVAQPSTDANLEEFTQSKTNSPAMVPMDLIATPLSQEILNPLCSSIRPKSLESLMAITPELKSILKQPGSGNTRPKRKVSFYQDQVGPAPPMPAKETVQTTAPIASLSIPHTHTIFDCLSESSELPTVILETIFNNPDEVAVAQPICHMPIPETRTKATQKIVDILGAFSDDDIQLQTQFSAQKINLTPHPVSPVPAFPELTHTITKPLDNLIYGSLNIGHAPSVPIYPPDRLAGTKRKITSTVTQTHFPLEDEIAKRAKLNPQQWQREISIFEKYYNLLTYSDNESPWEMAVKILPAILPREPNECVMHALHALEICFLRRTIERFSSFHPRVVSYMENVMIACEKQCKYVTFKQIAEIEAKYKELKKKYKNALINHKIDVGDQVTLDNAVQQTDAFLKEWNGVIRSIFPTASRHLFEAKVTKVVDVAQQPLQQPSSMSFPCQVPLTDTEINDNLVDNLLGPGFNDFEAIRSADSRKETLSVFDAIAENQGDTGDGFVPSYFGDDSIKPGFMSTDNDEYLMQQLNECLLVIDNQPDSCPRNLGRNDVMISGGSKPSRMNVANSRNY